MNVVNKKGIALGLAGVFVLPTIYATKTLLNGYIRRKKFEQQDIKIKDILIDVLLKVGIDSTYVITIESDEGWLIYTIDTNYNDLNNDPQLFTDDRFKLIKANMVTILQDELNSGFALKSKKISDTKITIEIKPITTSDKHHCLRLIEKDVKKHDE